MAGSPCPRPSSDLAPAPTPDPPEEAEAAGCILERAPLPSPSRDGLTNGCCRGLGFLAAISAVGSEVHPSADRFDTGRLFAQPRPQANSLAEKHRTPAGLAPPFSPSVHFHSSAAGESPYAWPHA